MATELDRLIVRIEADLAELKRGLAGAEQATNRSSQRMSRSFASTDRAISNTIASVGKLRNVLLGLGAIQLGRSIIGDFAAFEKGLIGVGKTTNLAGAELDALGRDIQDLAQRVPEATTTLLEIAKSAGQLGVQGRNNIVKFTEVIGKLGGATDLSGEAAASTLARLLNITNTSIGDIDRLGASIVDLGNNFAATEAEIADVALRVARGTAPFRVSLADTLAIATALRAVGVEAEAGGSVILRAFQQINKGLEQGGDELAALVAITGRSVEELKEQFGRDATGAFLQFVEASGEIATNKLPAFLELMGLEGVRAAGILQALAGRADELRRALEVSNRAWKENTALNIEANRALEALDAQWTLTLNAVSELGTAIGAVLAPSIKDILGDVRSLAVVLIDATNALRAFFEEIANSPLGRFIAEVNKLDPTRLAFEALTARPAQAFPAEGITIPLPPPLPTSRQGTRNPPLPGGGDKVAKDADAARKQIEESIRALEVEAQIASTVASKREELAAVLALENTARQGGIRVQDEQIARTKAAIAVIQQQAREEEQLAKIQAAETKIGEDIEELQLRLRFAGQETEEFRVQLRLLELRRDLESQITPEMEAQVRQAERLRSGLDQLIELRQDELEKTRQIESAVQDLGLVFNSAFEDAIINGERFGDVLAALEKDLLRLGLRKLVTEPLFEGITAGAAGRVQGEGIEGVVSGAIATVSSPFRSGAPDKLVPPPPPKPPVPGSFLPAEEPSLLESIGAAIPGVKFGTPPIVPQTEQLKEFERLGEAASKATSGLETAASGAMSAGSSMSGELVGGIIETVGSKGVETATTQTLAAALLELQTAATAAATALSTLASSSGAGGALSLGSSFAGLDFSSAFGGGPGLNTVSNQFGTFLSTVGRAHGGRVSGPGGSTADRIPAMLSDGEFVVNAEAAKKHGALLEAINSGRFDPLRRMAAGGFVVPQLPDRRPTASAAMPTSAGLRPIQIIIQTQSGVGEINRNMPQIRARMREAIDRAEARGD